MPKGVKTDSRPGFVVDKVDIDGVVKEECRYEWSQRQIQCQL